jgi:uncharacterized protein YkwD
MNIQSVARTFLHFTFLIAVIPLFSCSEKLQASAPVEAVSTVTLENYNKDILLHINEYRLSKGLDALQMNPVISAEAEKHSTNMAQKRTAFGHDGFPARVTSIKEKIGFVQSSAENVAYGHLTPKEVVSGWIKSPGHRKNIEGKFTLTGIGVAKDRSGTIFFTQIFARQ